jgi:Holliday junction resolvase-like predicted endonuclease
MAKNKGNYYKLRTKKWLEGKGYQVATIEKMYRVIDKKTGKTFFTKQDQFASDLLAMNDKEIIFIQVKSNAARGSINEAIKEFELFKFPKSAQKWVVIWETGDHEPEIVEA